MWPFWTMHVLFNFSGYLLPTSLKSDLFVLVISISWEIQWFQRLRKVKCTIGRKKKWKPVCVLEAWVGQLQIDTWGFLLTGIYLTSGWNAINSSRWVRKMFVASIWNDFFFAPGRKYFPISVCKKFIYVDYYRCWLVGASFLLWACYREEASKCSACALLVVLAVEDRSMAVHHGEQAVDFDGPSLYN